MGCAFSPSRTDRRVTRVRQRYEVATSLGYASYRSCRELVPSIPLIYVDHERADERTRTADLLSLRVQGELNTYIGECQNRSVPSIMDHLARQLLILVDGADNPSTQERGGCGEPPVFGVVCFLQSTSSLAQQELRGEHLVVWLPTHNPLDVPPGCSHHLSNVLGEFCYGRTRKLLGRRYELRDTSLTLLGVDVFVVVVQHISARVVLGDYPLVLLHVQEYSYAVPVLVHYVTSRHYSLVSSSSF
jgi:hypothetical protein